MKTSKKFGPSWGRRRPRPKRLPGSWRRRLVHALLALGVSGPAAVGADAENPAAPAPAPAPAPVAGADLTEVSLEQLMNLKVQSVYAASKHEQKISEAPASVTVVDSDEIEKYGYKSFADILRSVRGLYVTYDRNYSYLGIRGFNRPGDYNSRVLVLVNGHRVNENVFDSALLGHEFPVDVDLIDRVEVIRGPSSSIYGNNAFFGVINVITKKGLDFQGGEVSAGAGSFGTYQGRFSYGRKLTNDWEFMLSGSYYNSDGQSSLYFPEFNSPSNNVNNGVARHTDYETFFKTFASVSWRDFTLEGAYSSREKGIPTGAYGVIFNDDRAKTRDDRGYLNLKFDHAFNDDTELSANAFYDHYFYQGDYPLDYGAYDVTYKDFARGDWWGIDSQVIRRFGERVTLTVGGEYHDNVRQDQESYDNEPRVVYFDDHRSTWNFGFYGQGEVAILTNLILNAGVRYDKFETFGDTVNPRVGLIYSPVEPTTFKALYGTAFKAPNAYELYYSGVNLKGNLDLKPEEITTYELVWEQQIGKHLQFGASGFYYTIDNLINQTVDPFDGYLVYRNSDQVTAYGAEVELQGKFARGLRGRVSYAYQETRDEETDSSLSNSPHHLARFNLIVPLYQDKFFSGLEVQYNGAVKSISGRGINDFWLVNVTLFSQKIVKNLEASISVYNLFDQKYYFTGASEHLLNGMDRIEQDGISWWLKLNYRF